VSDSCIFCEIVAGRAPAHVVYEDDHCLAFLDANPYTEGHCLVIPKRHEPWWDDLSEEETAALFHACRDVAKRLREVYHPDFVFMYARGRRIPHTHVFLIPTYGGDMLDRFFGALEMFQESPPLLAALRTPAAMSRATSRLRGK
jgi:histidine triad (HIT) family protein